MITVLTRQSQGDASGVAAWTEAIEDPREALYEVGQIVKRDVRERWDAEVDPWGAPWTPRSITTLEIREKQGKDPHPRPIVPRARTTERGKAVRVGFGGPIARYFHEGDPNASVFGRGRGPRPARPVLPLAGGALRMPEQLAKAVMDAFRAEVRRAIRRSRRG